MLFIRLFAMLSLAAAWPIVPIHANGDSTIVALPMNPYSVDANRACGPICLAFLDAYYGGHRGCAMIARMCPPGPEGTSLGQLQTTARQLGYGTLAFKTTPRLLPRLQYPAILHLENTNGRDHFVVLTKWNSKLNKGVVFSPPRSLRLMSLDSLAKHFSGRGLVVSRTRELTLTTAARASDNLLFGTWIAILVVVCFVAYIGRKKARNSFV